MGFSRWVIYGAFALALLAFLRAMFDHLFLRKRVRDLHRRVLANERLLRLRGTLANEVAHELKNPLTAILCSAETLDLLIGDKLPPEHQKSLSFIREYGDGMLRMVSDFLDVSIAESGYMKATPERVELSSCIRAALGLLESNALRKQISLRCLPTTENLTISVDPKHLKQIIFNLVHNAIKFTPHGGEVQVVIESDFPMPRARIIVRDNGIGIAAHLLPSLFDPYARYEGNETDYAAGVGLGLALCKSLVELAGGTISVDSSEGVGTAFSVTFPMHTVQAEVEKPNPIYVSQSIRLNLENSKPLEGQRFLVADDDTGARETVSDLIKAWGGIVDKAVAAAEVVDAVQQRVYDAIMIDNDFDGGYGCELARLIREDFNPKGTTLILTTRDSKDFARAKEAGVDKCVEKPLNGRVLLNSLVNSGKYSITH